MQLFSTCAPISCLRKVSNTALLLITAGLIGCARPSPFEAWKQPRPALATNSAYAHTSINPTSTTTALAKDHTPERKGAAPQRAALSKTTQLQKYVHLALARSPAIKTARQHVAQMAAQIGLATSLSDPVFNISPLGDMAQTATGQVGLMASLKQKFPWPGKLSTKEKIAKTAVIVAVAQLRQTQLRVANQTRKAYWQLYAAGRSLKQIKKLRPLLIAVKKTAMAKLRAGAASQSDVLRASVEISTLDRKAAIFIQQRQTAAAMLNTLLNRPVGTLVASPNFADGKNSAELNQQINLKKSQLLAQAIRHNPAIAKAKAKIAASNQKLHLAKLAPIPDLTVGVHYNSVDDSGVVMSPSGRDQWWLSFGITLPIWNGKYDALKSAALARALQSSSQLQSAKNQVSFAVQSAFFAVNNRQTQWQLFHKQIIPQAQQAANDALARYRSGKTQFIDCLDAWRRLLTLELAETQNRAVLGKALADLKKAVGTRLSTTSKANQSSPGHSKSSMTKLAKQSTQTEVNHEKK